MAFNMETATQYRTFADECDRMAKQIQARDHQRSGKDGKDLENTGRRSKGGRVELVPGFFEFILFGRLSFFGCLDARFQ